MTEYSFKGKKIWLVHDSPAMREPLAGLLTHFNAEVTVFSDADKASRALRREVEEGNELPSVIISDYKFTPQRGYMAQLQDRGEGVKDGTVHELLMEMKSLDVERPILIITGAFEDELEPMNLMGGKVINAEDMLPSVEHILANQEQSIQKRINPEKGSGRGKAGDEKDES